MKKEDIETITLTLIEGDIAMDKLRSIEKTVDAFEATPVAALTDEQTYTAQFIKELKRILNE